MGDRYEVRLSGEGGQGLGFAGLILAEALSQENSNVVETQSYEPQTRGGASSSEVVMSDEIIGYPKVSHPDILLAMTQEACDQFAPEVSTRGFILADSTRVQRKPQGSSAKMMRIPLAKLAAKKTGTAVVSNMIALGILAMVAGLVNPESLRNAIALRAPEGTREINRKALELGLRIGQRMSQRYNCRGLSPRNRY